MKLLIVDGHALAYRSYYAMIRNPLSNSSGENTSAEFGFLLAYQATLREKSPDAVLVCFDPVGKTFRHERYVEYKAQRPKMPQDLRDSIAKIQEYLDLIGTRWLRIEGFEADDVMATAARMAESEGWDVLLMTGDKDMCQIVSDKVRLLRPAAGKRPAGELDPAGVEAEFGVKPRAILDYLSLIGDSSDNVPGVPGLGPKGAVKLLAAHPNLDAIYANLDAIEPKGVRNKLEQGRESAELSRELIRLVEDVEIGEGLMEWSPGKPDIEGLKAWLLGRGFQSMVAELEKPAEEAEDKKDYPIIQDEAAIAELAQTLKKAGRFAVDTETTSLDPSKAELVGMSFSWENGCACYLPVAGACMGDGLSLDLLQAALAPLLADDGLQKVAQNLKYDARVLARHGLPIAGPCFDTMLASYCVDPSRRSHGLDNLALDLLGHGMIPYDSLFEKGDKEKDIKQVPLELLGPYAAEDADLTLQLADLLDPALDENGVRDLFEQFEMPLVPVLSDMEEAGIGLDVKALGRSSIEMETARAELSKKIFEAAGREFTIGSPKQLSAILFDEMGLPTGKRIKTGFSTDEQVLSGLAGEHDIAGWVLEWRELSKLKSTYVDSLPTMVNAETGRVHTRYNQAVAATGRLSSSDPNLQNIPIRSKLGKSIRATFIAPPGRLLASFDYSQIELRILAHLSGDEALREAFASDRDIHRWTAARIGGIEEDEVDRDARDRSKVVNYGVLYGMGARGLAGRLRISRDEAQGFIDEYFASFPGIKIWIDTVLMEARTNAATSTLFGRRRALPEINSSNGRLRSFAERVAVNTPIQGTAADLIKRAMIDVAAALTDSKIDARMLLQVHDELIFEVAEGELDALVELIRPLMERAPELNVALIVDWGSGKNWLEAH